MTGWIYLAGGVFSVLPLARMALIGLETDGHGLESEDRGFALFLGSLTATIWPLAWVLLLIFWIGTRLAPSLLRTPREIQADREQKERTEQERYREALRIIAEYDARKEKP